jgi:hypothetical protein
MRVLVTSGVFAADNDSESGEELYRLTPLSRILVHGVVAHEHHSQKYFVLGVTSPHCAEAALGLADWFKKDIEAPVPSPFEHKRSILSPWQFLGCSMSTLSFIYMAEYSTWAESCPTRSSLVCRRWLNDQDSAGQLDTGD